MNTKILRDAWFSVFHSEKSSRDKRLFPKRFRANPQNKVESTQHFK